MRHAKMNERVWTIRAYKDGDETGYIELMNRVFQNSKFNLKQWRWEFPDNPFGFLQVFGDFHGKIVGHMALVQVPMKIGDCTVQGSQAVDLAVHPDFRRQRMFLEIGKNLMQYAKREEVAISYGVPNEAAYRGHLKYGWFYVSEIPVLVRVLTQKGFLFQLLGGLCRLRQHKFQSFSELFCLIKGWANTICFILTDNKGTANSEEWKEQTVKSFDNRIDRLWAKASKQYRLLVVRDKEYLNWRYAKRPHSSYVIKLVERKNRIEGYVVLLIKISGLLRKKEGYIVDILAKSERAIHCLMQSAIDYFSKENVDLIICWMMEGQPPFNCLIRRGFTIDSFDSQKLICLINSSDPKFKRLYHEAQKEWFFTVGDTDIV